MPTRSGLTRKDYPAISGGVVFDTVRGKLRIRSWPNPRGLSLSPHTKYMNDWFSDATFKIKRVDAKMTSKAMTLSAGTGLYPRDVLMKAGSRPFYSITLPDGSILEPKRIGFQEVAFQGAILELEVNTAQAGGFAAVPVWPMPTVNTAGMFVPSIPDRFTIPPGINIVSLTFNWSRVGASSGQYASFIRKNGSDLLGGANWSNVGTPAMSVTTGPISVSPGDYFQAMLNLIPGPATLLGVQTRFTCEILDASLTPPP